MIKNTKRYKTKLKNFLRDKDKRILIFIIIINIFYGILSVKTIFRKGKLIGWDHPAHLFYSYLTLRFFVEEHIILGYDPYDHLGWVFNQFYNVGHHLYLTSLYLLLQAFLKIDDIYKVAFTIAYILPAITSIFLMKYIYKNTLSSFLLSFALLTLSNYETGWYEAGLKEMYEIGMWHHRLALSIAPIVFLMYLKFLKEKMKKFKKNILLILTGLLLAISISIYIILGIALIISIAIIFFIRNLIIIKELLIKKKCSKKIVFKNIFFSFLSLNVILLISILINLYWLFPFLIVKDTLFIFPDKENLGTGSYYMLFRTLNPFQLVLIIITPFLSVFRHRKKDKKLYHLLILSIFFEILIAIGLVDHHFFDYVILPILFILVYLIYITEIEDTLLFLLISLTIIFLSAFSYDYSSRPVVGYIYKVISFIPMLPKYLLFNRFILFSRYLLLIVVYSSLSKIISYIGSRKSIIRLTLIIFFISYNLYLQILNTDILYPIIPEKKFKLSTDYTEIKLFDDLFLWINKNVEDNTYIYVEDILMKKFPDLPKSHYFYYIPLYTSKPVIGGMWGTKYISYPIVNSETNIMLGHELSFWEKNPSLMEIMSEELGITYFIVSSKKLVRILNSSEYFILLYSSKLYSIFRTRKYNPIVTGEKNVKILNISLKPNFITLKVKVLGQNSKIYIRLINFPYWNIICNNAKVTLSTFFQIYLKK